MEFSTFSSDFANLFDETDKSHFTKELNFKSLTEWSSLIALSLIVMCDDNYGIKITAADINNSETLNDFFNILVK